MVCGVWCVKEGDGIGVGDKRALFSCFVAMLENVCTLHVHLTLWLPSCLWSPGEMIERLQLTFNRTRQAVITRELIEIISGAAALD